MAKHGNKRHMKRVAAPKLVQIARKAHKWMSKPLPGAHAESQAVPLSVV